MNKLSFLIILFSLFSLTLNAYDYDCGCSVSTPAGSISTGYDAVNGDCCNQLGAAEVSTYNDANEWTSSTYTYLDVTHKCDSYGC